MVRALLGLLSLGVFIYCYGLQNNLEQMALMSQAAFEIGNRINQENCHILLL